MSISVTVTRSWAQAGQDPVSHQKSFSEGSLVSISESIPDGSTDKLVEVAISVARLKALLIGSDQDLTLEINHPGGSSTAPDQTFDLKGKSPIDWTEDDAEDCPLEVDVTAIYVTNDSGAAAQLEIRALRDPTPEE